MVSLTDLAESHEAYEEWAQERDNEDLGLKLRNDFLGLARRFLQMGGDALLHWRGQTGIPVRESGGHVLVELSRFDDDGTEWVRVR